MAFDFPILGNDDDIATAKEAARLNAPKLLANFVRPNLPRQPILGMPEAPDLGNSELIRGAGGMSLLPSAGPRKPILDMTAPDVGPSAAVADAPTSGFGILGNTRGPTRPPGRGTAEDWEGQRLGVGPRPEYHDAKKVFDILGSVAVPEVMQRAKLGTLGWESKLLGAERADKAAEASLFERARTTEQEAKAEQERAKANALRNPLPRADRTIPPETDDYYSLLDQINPATGRKYTSQEALEQVKGAGKQDRQFTNAFEAFAYGTPEQKQAAKDFIDYEKRVGARYRTPTEFDLRYKLFREDPETYRAMFGDKGEAADERARAANRSAAMSVLMYTQHQRDEISKDFMLGEDERAQKLRDLDEFERPFKETVAGGGAGGSGDRVNVIAPDGTRGTVPRSQLGAAKRKGYRVAQ